MARYDFRTPRLFVESGLTAGARIALDRGQTTYLSTVLRLKPGAGVLIFNGREGEWLSELAPTAKKSAELIVGRQVRDQTQPCDLRLCFAPLKHARLDYLVQKAVELGAGQLAPVMTQHTQSERVNLTRMRANAIEAAEQCGILTIPDIGDPSPLLRFLDGRDPSRLLVFCDEDAEVADPIAALGHVRASIAGIDVLIGPEGGFSEEERRTLTRLSPIVRLSLGPRILRADTAAVAALALVQAVLGDWR